MTPGGFIRGESSGANRPGTRPVLDAGEPLRSPRCDAGMGGYGDTIPVCSTQPRASGEVF